MAAIGSPDQVLRVNHAGERGAICIYQSQLAISRLLHPSCVEPLTEMLGHERQHYQRFDSILKARGIRHCHALALWALGGWLLGGFTALLGRRAIWVCTAAIENTVNAHLEHQVAFLRGKDEEILAAVEAIRRDEEAHEHHARGSGGEAGGLYVVLRWIIGAATGFAIWLSTKL
jgi:3-demethoxyubiquinol 3-hydroxylase